ncbi:MAG TPA: aldehyde dehydrogenase family protein [bacterium]|nr:aldehyde dehydrogenase family protein [bacterium]
MSTAQDAQRTRVIVDTNPADSGDVLAEVSPQTVADVARAIERAKRAYPAWRATPPPERGRILARAAAVARARLDELARLLTREEGKVLSEARGEVLKGINLLEWYSGEGLRLGGKTRPSEMPTTLLWTMRQPLGVVAVITPWNFPWAEPAWKVAPALVAGNTVLLKPASLTPLVAQRYVEILTEAGLPDGVLTLIVGAGGEVGHALVSDPEIRAVSFTGSCEIGGDVYARAAGRLAKVTCEMGGKNAVVVMPDADLDLAVTGIAQGAFGSTGQRCTATSLGIVHRDVSARVRDLIVDRARALRVGNGLEDGVEMGPLVDAHQLETVLGYIEAGRHDGARLLTGGRRLADGNRARGFFVEPTVFADVRPAHRIAREEIFGPVLSLIEVASLDEALEVTNGLRYGLTSSIYAGDANTIMRFVDGVEAGMVHVNSPTVGGEAQIPFGGIKWSGAGGREMAEEGLEFFTELKSVFFDYTGRVRSGNIY